MAYLGNNLQVAFPSYRNIDDISGSFNGVTTSFPLLVSGAAPVPLPVTSNQCLISVAGVVQRPDDSGSEGFRLTGGNIVFSSAPAGGADFFGVILAGADYVHAGGQFPAGLATAPSIAFSSDPDTGLFNPAANEIAITTGGSEKLRIDSAGQLEATSLGTAAAPTYTFNTDPNTGIYSPGADQLAISTNGTQRLLIEADGDINIDSGGVFYDATNNRLAIGTTSVGHKLDLLVGGGADGINVYNNATGAAYYQLATTSRSYKIEATGSDLRFYDNTGSAERARIDSSGRLLVGTSSARSNFFNTTGIASVLQVEGTDVNTLGSLVQNSPNSAPVNFILGKSRSSTVNGSTAVVAEDGIGRICFQAADGSELVGAAEIGAFVDGTPGANDMPGRLVFSTTADGASSPTERMRIFNGGGFSIYSSTTSNDTIDSCNNQGAGTTYSTFIGRHSATSTQSGTVSVRIYTNGNIQNTNGSYTTLSDAKLKENIVDAGSQWDDLRAIKIRKWNFKAETGHETHQQIGPIAQELETVCPGLVFETPGRDADGNETGEFTKGVNQSVLYMKAVKALQEAMERIEILEAKVAALESA